MASSSYLIQNLIQGVSQQSAEQRRATQCEEQLNCLNSPKDGCVARPSLLYLSQLDDADFSDSAIYELFRGTEERYLVIIPNNATVGEIRVWDWNNRVECTVTTDGSEEDYLACGSRFAKDLFRFQTVDDFTFIINRNIPIAMTADVQTSRPPEALIFVKAGNYSQKYQVVIYFGAVAFRWMYMTPDNSTVDNGPYINTSAIAATLYRAMAGEDQTIIVSGGAAPNPPVGVGALFTGDTGTVGVVEADFDELTDNLGFSFQLRGNVIRVWREDLAEFTIDAGDGSGNTFMIAVKDRAKSLNDLPLKAFTGFRIAIAGTSVTAVDDYFVEYTADDVWQEVAADGTTTTLDPATMPHTLINTAPGTFEFQPADWSTRVAGDDDSAPLPYFVGRAPMDIFHVYSRLFILTEAAYDTSKTRAPYTWFPDTVQTVLGTAPINEPVNGRRSISLLRKGVVVDESLFLWGQENQWRIAADNQPFTQATVTAKPATAFNFAEAVDPVVLGATLYFVSEPENTAALKAVTFSANKASPPLDVTMHIPGYIPAGARQLTASETLGMMFLRTEGTASGLYLYSFIVQGAEIVQSAWQTWTLPPGEILWCSIHGSRLDVMVQRPQGVLFGSISLTTHTTSSSIDPGGLYATRLDWMVEESAVNPTLNADGNTTTLTYPYKDADVDSLRVVIRTDSADYVRGQLVIVVAVTDDEIIVEGDLTEQEFYVGLIINSVLVMSQFWPRDPNGVTQLFDAVTVKSIEVSHAKTSYYKVEVHKINGTSDTNLWTSRRVSVPEGQTGPLNPWYGSSSFPVQMRNNEHYIILRNDSPFPSAWQRAKISYSFINRGASDANQ